MFRHAMILALCLAPLTAIAADGDGFKSEISRFRNELRNDQAVLSPGLSSHFDSESNRLARMPDRTEAARELRALDQDLAFSQSSLTGSYSTLLGPTGQFPNVYAPSTVYSSPKDWGMTGEVGMR